MNGEAFALSTYLFSPLLCCAIPPKKNKRFQGIRVVKKTGFENQFFQKLVFKKKKKTEKSGGEKKTDTFHQAFL